MNEKPKLMMDTLMEELVSSQERSVKYLRLVEAHQRFVVQCLKYLGAIKDCYPAIYNECVSIGFFKRV